jgi:hypothetical protein
MKSLRVGHVEVTTLPEFSGTLVIRGMTLIDERSAAFSSMILSENHTVQLANSGDVKIYEYTGTLPRAYLVCGARIVQSQEEAWERLKEDQTTVIVDEPPASEPDCNPENPGEVTINTYEPERVVIHVKAHEEGNYLILSDSWYPGWEATIDGEPVEILHANGLFRAVRIPQGEHEVIFTYRSRMLEIGGVISGATLLLVIIGLTVPLPRLWQMIQSKMT